MVMYKRVVKYNGKWAVKDELGSSIISLHNSRKEAIDNALKLSVSDYFSSGKEFGMDISQKKRRIRYSS
jgi:hypothetical protein